MKLHIGGRERKEGWSILNAQPGPVVDIVGDFRDLSGFEDESVDAVYASHVLEHLDMASEALAALKELHRIVRPDGCVMISVPDVAILSQLILHPQATPELQLHLMRVLFGGQTDPWDYHKSGYTEAVLLGFLGNAGFMNVVRVPEFGLFNDTSSLKIAGVPISLNVEARKY